MAFPHIAGADLGEVLQLGDSSLTWPDAGSHALTADYVYDALNAMTAIEENGATSGPGLLASLGYDGLGRLTGRTTAGGAGLSTSWAYGDNGLLASLTQTLAGGAGTTLGFTYSAARQILTRSDSNGAYTAQPPAQSSTYAANGLNQVVSATGTRGGPAAAAGLAYDPLGRISTDTENGSTTSFLYAGWSLVGEYSSSGAILARYVPGAGMDAPVTMYTGPGTASRAWYAADQQGSILALADASGNATLQLAYGPYGEPLTPAGASAWGESRYGYTGQIGIAGALAWFDKARMYDPAQGRFLQTDPLGLSAGTNLYAYAVQDPINTLDPLGLFQIILGTIGACTTIETYSETITTDGDGTMVDQIRNRQFQTVCLGGSSGGAISGNYDPGFSSAARSLSDGSAPSLVPPPPCAPGSGSRFSNAVDATEAAHSAIHNAAAQALSQSGQEQAGEALAASGRVLSVGLTAVSQAYGAFSDTSAGAPIGGAVAVHGAGFIGSLIAGDTGSEAGGLIGFAIGGPIGGIVGGVIGGAVGGYVGGDASTGLASAALSANGTCS